MRETFSNERVTSIAMFKPTFVRAIIVLLIAATTCLAQSLTDGLIDAAKSWLKNINSGSRTELLASTDDRFIATTPAGDVLVRERLIPTDTSQPVQQLPLTLSKSAAAFCTTLSSSEGIEIGRRRPSSFGM
jgi:hypothetical protein